MRKMLEQLMGPQGKRFPAASVKCTTQYYHPWDKLIGLLTSHVILKMAGHALKSVLFRLVHSSLIFLYS